MASAGGRKSEPNVSEKLTSPVIVVTVPDELQRGKATKNRLPSVLRNVNSNEHDESEKSTTNTSSVFLSASASSSRTSVQRGSKFALAPVSSATFPRRSTSTKKRSSGVASRGSSKNDHPLQRSGFSRSSTLPGGKAESHAPSRRKNKRNGLTEEVAVSRIIRWYRHASLRKHAWERVEADADEENDDGVVERTNSPRWLITLKGMMYAEEEARRQEVAKAKAVLKRFFTRLNGRVEWKRGVQGEQRVERNVVVVQQFLCAMTSQWMRRILELLRQERAIATIQRMWQRSPRYEVWLAASNNKMQVELLERNEALVRRRLERANMEDYVSLFQKHSQKLHRFLTLNGTVSNRQENSLLRWGVETSDERHQSIVGRKLQELFSMDDWTSMVYARAAGMANQCANLIQMRRLWSSNLHAGVDRTASLLAIEAAPVNSSPGNQDYAVAQEHQPHAAADDDDYDDSRIPAAEKEDEEGTERIATNETALEFELRSLYSPQLAYHLRQQRLTEMQVIAERAAAEAQAAAQVRDSSSADVCESRGGSCEQRTLAALQELNDTRIKADVCDSDILHPDPIYFLIAQNSSDKKGANATKGTISSEWQLRKQVVGTPQTQSDPSEAMRLSLAGTTKNSSAMGVCDTFLGAEWGAFYRSSVNSLGTERKWEAPTIIRNAWTDDALNATASTSPAVRQPKFPLFVSFFSPSAHSVPQPCVVKSTSIPLIQSSSSQRSMEGVVSTASVKLAVERLLIREYHRRLKLVEEEYFHRDVLVQKAKRSAAAAMTQWKTYTTMDHPESKPLFTFKTVTA